MSTTPTTAPAAAEAFKECGCIKAVNDMLAEKYGRVMTLRHIVRITDDDRCEAVAYAPELVTERLTTAKGRKPVLYARFCPFCGQKLWPSPTPDARACELIGGAA
jgi:NADH pyrophosphatase NudC (nudix superfamily)